MASMPSIKSREIKIVQDIPISKTLKFWEGLKEGKIYATKCHKCGRLYFPPSADCSECLCSEMDWIELSSEAEIETFTHVVFRPTSFCEYKPYTVAIGKLKEGVQVLAWLTGFKLSQIKVGMKVKLVAKTSQERNPTYEFVPPETQ
ncbi:MAG: Zn-ribbon domain-containing OB-fold protein [Candidatus Bathyarchaeota archaeon]|nr:Zn-ribbon domain-containing OB-fold protein [Candidatus Bathyarchaeota archaeon A05DMB-5]MDH7557626.1 Zn-ribbon domain-containing OB-fold protein [Candidatus Bathyarchaeota archaeon]